MGKISEIMLLKQPEHAALVVEVQTDMQGMSKAIGKNFVAIDALFKEQNEITTDIPFVEYPELAEYPDDYRIEIIREVARKRRYQIYHSSGKENTLLPAPRKL